METTKWMDELVRMAKADPWYQEWLAKANSLETEFRRIRDALPKEDQNLLDDYISACEELDNSMTLLAYHQGRIHGLRDALTEKPHLPD